MTGMSAECADGTLVLLEGALHETRNELQNSLRATPQRLPIEGEPCECEQEAANGVMTAGCMNGMVETAEPQIADVNGMTLLGRGPAQRVGGVDKGDEERKPQTRLLKAEFYCEETNQHNENANRNVPIAYRLPLEGEWTGYASSKASNPKGNENTSNAAIEHADGLREQCRLADVDGVVSEGCNGGTSKCVSVDEVDSDPGREVEPADSPNEPEALITMSIESEYPDGGEIPCICIGGTSWRACDVEGHGDRADESKGWLSGWTDTLNVLNSTEIACISHNDDLDTYLGAAGMKCPVHETDGVRNHADMPIGHRDTPSIETETETAENERGNVRTGQIGLRT